MTRLHRDEVAIDESLVERLLRSQLPEFADLPLKAVGSQGTDNIVYRLGAQLSVRLPRKASAVPSLLVEREWLPRLAPELPLAVPVPVAAGEPDELYPLPWMLSCLSRGVVGSSAADHVPVLGAVKPGR